MFFGVFKSENVLQTTFFLFFFLSWSHFLKACCSQFLCSPAVEESKEHQSLLWRWSFAVSLYEGVDWVPDFMNFSAFAHQWAISPPACVCCCACWKSWDWTKYQEQTANCIIISCRTTSVKQKRGFHPFQCWVMSFASKYFLNSLHIKYKNFNKLFFFLPIQSWYIIKALSPQIFISLKKRIKQKRCITFFLFCYSAHAQYIPAETSIWTVRIHSVYQDSLRLFHKAPFNTERAQPCGGCPNAIQADITALVSALLHQKIIL